MSEVAAMMQAYSITRFQPWICGTCRLAVPAMVEHGKDQGCQNPTVLFAEPDEGRANRGLL